MRHISSKRHAVIQDSNPLLNEERPQIGIIPQYRRESSNSESAYQYRFRVNTPIETMLRYRTRIHGNTSLFRARSKNSSRRYRRTPHNPTLCPTLRAVNPYKKTGPRFQAWNLGPEQHQRRRCMSGRTGHQDHEGSPVTRGHDVAMAENFHCAGLIFSALITAQGISEFLSRRNRVR